MKWNVLFRWGLFWILAFGMVAGILAPAIGCGNDPAGLLGLGHVLQQAQLDDLQEQIDDIEMVGDTGLVGPVGPIGPEGPKGDTGNPGQDTDGEDACTKVTVCHNASTIHICESAVQAHVGAIDANGNVKSGGHGDTLGKCDE